MRSIERNKIIKPLSSRGYEVIAADPPWQYCDKSAQRGGAERYYRTLSIEQIKSINVSEYAAKDSVLLLWATAPLMPEAIDTLRAWGFEYKTFAYVWVKRSKSFWDNAAKELRREIVRYYQEHYADSRKWRLSTLKALFDGELLKRVMQYGFKIGMGAFSRANAEVVLLGTRGQAAKMVESHAVRQVMDDCISEHSRKPDEFYDRTLKLFGDRKRLDMFARINRDGWDSLGNELEHSTCELNRSMELCEVVSHESLLSFNVRQGLSIQKQGYLYE